MKDISSLYLKPKTVIFTFHSVPSDQPRSSVRPDLLPRVFCWDWEFCASGTCSVILAQRAAGPWQEWCCNRNISKLTCEQQRWLETHRNEARKILSQQNLELFHSAPSQAIELPQLTISNQEGRAGLTFAGELLSESHPSMLCSLPVQPWAENGGNSAFHQFWHWALSGHFLPNTTQFSLLLHPLLRSTSEPQMGTL